MKKPDFMANIKWEKARYEKTVELLQQYSGKKILDVGCGAGHFSKVLIDNKNVVTGIDDGDYRKEFDVIGGSYIGLDLEEGFPIFKDRFDVIVALGVLEHVKNLDPLIEILKKNLTDDGELFVCVPTEELNVFGSRLYRFSWLYGIPRKIAQKTSNIYKRIFGSDFLHSILSRIDSHVRRRSSLVEVLGASIYWEKDHVWKENRSWWLKKFEGHSLILIDETMDKFNINYFFKLRKGG